MMVALKGVADWTCDERDRVNCRNPHGCHCREITSLLARNEELTRKAAGLPPPVEINQVVTPRQMPGKDSVLERVDQAGDMADDIGPPVVIAPYRKPKDPRVQQLLRDAEAARKAEQQVPREIFRDPRLDPGYRAPKSKK